MKDRIKYTPQGYSYINVSIEECINGGGIGICDSCNKGPFKELKLIWALGDTYCQECFDEWLVRARNYNEKDIKYDLDLQKKNHLKWYELHVK